MCIKKYDLSIQNKFIVSLESLRQKILKINDLLNCMVFLLEHIMSREIINIVITAYGN